MVYGDLWWSVVVCGDLWWSVVICGGLSWSVVVCGGVVMFFLVVFLYLGKLSLFFTFVFLRFVNKANKN